MPGWPPESPIDAICPRCRFSDALLHHATRGATVYQCRNCEHQFEIAGGASTPDRSEDSAISETPIH